MEEGPVRTRVVREGQKLHCHGGPSVARGVAAAGIRLVMRQKRQVMGKADSLPHYGGERGVGAGLLAHQPCNASGAWRCAWSHNGWLGWSPQAPSGVQYLYL